MSCDRGRKSPSEALMAPSNKHSSSPSSSSSAAASAAASSPSSAALDNLVIQSLMSRLQLRPPYLDTNSFLSQNLHDFLLHDQLTMDRSDEEDEDEEELSSLNGAEGRRRRLLAREEAQLEKEIIRIIHSGNAAEALKANSGQSVAIGDHNICVGSHDDAGLEYRVWEWHGHIMFFDEDDGYTPEYIYGNYFERLSEKKGGKVDEAEGVEEESKVRQGGNSGLRDLIENSEDPVAGAGGRIVHRNSLNSGSAARAEGFGR